ncbi:histidine kinase, partial [Streptococcus pyogenes]
MHRLPNRLIPEEDNNKLSRVAKEVVTEPRLNNPFLLPKKVLSLEDDAAILNHLEEDRNVNKLFLEPVAAEAKREINFHP